MSNWVLVSAQPGACYSQLRQEGSSYLHMSLSPFWTRTRGGMCSCNSQVCSGTAHCHRAVCSPSTHQCLEATIRRQQIHAAKKWTAANNTCSQEMVINDDVLLLLVFPFTPLLNLVFFLPTAHSLSLSKLYWVLFKWNILIPEAFKKCFEVPGRSVIFGKGTLLLYFSFSYCPEVVLY